MVEPLGGGLFRILGPVELRSGEKWTSVKAGKQRALLAMLLLHSGQPVSQDRLIEALWDATPPKGAVNLLSVYVHQLRKQMGEDGSRVLVTRPPGYQAVLEPGELDADLFAELLSEGRQALANNEPERAADLLAGALECWQGEEPLADVDANPVFATGRARLAESRSEAISLRAEAELACGRPAEVVAQMRDLLRGNSLQEKWWALLMRALRQDGRQAEALEAYDQARNVIRHELGVDPGPELQQLFQRILEADAGGPAADAGQGAGPVPRPQQLPADIADFTGRADQVEQVCALMAEDGPGASPGAVRVVVVMGAGGLGKTTLAVHAAHLLKDQFPGGQLYANLLGATQPAAPADILARFLRDLGMDGFRVPLDTEERATHFRTRLADRRMLIVLDDARDAAQVLPLLPGSASAAVLVTSRNRLPELMGSQAIDLEVLRPEEARSLFTGMVGERRAAAEPEAASDVLAACAGLPLAIRIVGARLAARGNWTVRTLADRLADERGRLDEMRVGNLAVRASFEVSFSSLAGAEPGGVDPAWAFCLLGVWTGPSIGIVAAAALLGQPSAAVADALYVLVDAHLLESPEPDWFRFHDLLRVFAADRALIQESEQTRHDAIARVLTWYLHSAEAAAEIISPHHARVPLDPPPPTVQPLSFGSLEAAVEWCERERLGVIAAIRLAADTGLHEIAWKLAAAEMSFFYRRSHWAEWVETHNIGLASAKALGDRPAEAWILNNLGMAFGVQGMEESVDCFEQALAISRELSDVWGEGRAIANVANAYYRLHRFAEARSAAERSVTIQRLAGNRYGEGIALDALGSSCEKLGEFSAAIDYLNAALVIFQELGEADSEAETLTDLGDAFLGLGQVEDAIDSLERALSLRQRIGDRHGQAATLHQLGLAQLRAGQRDKAREYLAEALVLLEEIGDRAQIAEVQVQLPQIGREPD
jgi:DNA-binding SARP family transcriptional activator